MDLKEILEKAFDAGYDNSLMYNNLGDETYIDFDDFYKKEIEAINFTGSSLELKDKELISFEKYMMLNGFTYINNIFSRDGITYSESEMVNRYEVFLRKL